MKIDKHYDPTDDLEKELLQELDDIARQLNGKITSKLSFFPIVMLITKSINNFIKFFFVNW